MTDSAEKLAEIGRCYKIGHEAWKTVEAWQRQNAGRRALAEAEGK